MKQNYYTSANLPNVQLHSRRQKKLDFDQSVVITALSFLRALSVDEVCELAEIYVQLNIPVKFQAWARRHKNMPVMQRAFLACCCKAEWGTFKWPR